MNPVLSLGRGKLASATLVTSTRENLPMRVTFLLTLGLVGFASCTTVTAPPVQDAVSNFRIVLDHPEYTPAEASNFGIQATVTNTSSDQDFYANVGDGFNSALEQSTIFAALGTQAVIERRVAGFVWENANTGLLIEGSRFVVLSAGRSYRLIGSIAPNSPGTYRIRLDYSTRMNDPSSTLFHDYSAAFLVR
jgi:hypothetical protein